MNYYISGVSVQSRHTGQRKASEGCIVVRNTKDNIMAGTKFSHQLQFYMFLKEYLTVYVFLKKKKKKKFLENKL
jgi:hypothetical protein